MEKKVEKKNSYRFIVLYTFPAGGGKDFVDTLREQFGEEKVKPLRDQSTIALSGDSVPLMKERLINICSTANFKKDGDSFVYLLYSGALANYKENDKRDSIILETIWPLENNQ